MAVVSVRQALFRREIRHIGSMFLEVARSLKPMLCQVVGVQSLMIAREAAFTSDVDRGKGSQG